jgi:hypothetical protein
MAVYNRADTAEYKSAPHEFKRNASVVAGAGILLGVPTSMLEVRATANASFARAYAGAGPALGDADDGLLAPPGASSKDQGSIALRTMRSVQSMARLGTGDRG